MAQCELVPRMGAWQTMKTTRRQFLIDLASTAITAAAGWAMTGVRVETPAPPEPRGWDPVGWLIEGAAWTDQSCITLDGRGYMVVENGRLVWRVPLDERTIAPELDGMPVDLEVSP